MKTQRHDDTNKHPACGWFSVCFYHEFDVLQNQSRICLKYSSRQQLLCDDEDEDEDEDEDVGVISCSRPAETL